MSNSSNSNDFEDSYMVSESKESLTIEDSLLLSDNSQNETNFLDESLVNPSIYKGSNADESIIYPKKLSRVVRKIKSDSESDGEHVLPVNTSFTEHRSAVEPSDDSDDSTKYIKKTSTNITNFESDSDDDEIHVPRVDKGFTQHKAVIESSKDSDDSVKCIEKSLEKNTTIDSDSGDDNINNMQINKSFTQHRSTVVESGENSDEDDPSYVDNSSHDIHELSDGSDIEFIENVVKKPNIHKIKDSDSEAAQIIDIKPELLDDKLYCTLAEYRNQQNKVANLRTDIEKCERILKGVNQNLLPDKGVLLRTRYGTLEKALIDEENILKKMVPDKSDNGEGPKIVSWEQIQSSSSSVVPRTFGKQAMQTLTIQKSLTMDRLKDLHESLKSYPTEETVVDTPQGVKSELMGHQKHALAWLLWRENQKPSGGILADDMGLGKTLTMIALIMKSMEITAIQEEKEDNGSDDENNEWLSKNKNSLINGGTLVVCPASLVQQWEQEIKKHCKRNMLNVELYHGLRRESRAHRLARHDIVITTYNLAMRDHIKKGPLFQVKWRRIILDEAHVVRNHKAQTSIAMCALASRSRWALTGTPVHNKEIDLYALLKFLRCSPFNDLQIWKRWIDNKGAGGQDRLNTVMATLMLRRTKQQLQAKGCLNSLPEKTFKVIEIELDKYEKQIYQKVLIFSRTLFAQFLHQRLQRDTGFMTAQRSENHKNPQYQEMYTKILRIHGQRPIKSHEILVLLLRLRQICCHPSLITKMLSDDDYAMNDIEEDDVDVDILEKLNKLDLNSEVVAGPSSDETVTDVSSRLLTTSNPIFKRDRINKKIENLLKLINKVVEKNDKIIIVSQWTSMLEICKEHIIKAGFRCDSLDGSIPVDKRSNIISTFNNPSHPTNILLLSLTAGGVGLNLVGANHLIFLDIHWNPQLESQAQDRIYRMGQKKPVYIYKIITMDTIEQQIKKLQELKLALANDILTGTKTRTNSKLSIDDLKMLFSIDKI